MDARRKELRMTWRRVAELARVSQETLRQLRMGEQVSEMTEYGVEEALHWRPGSLDAIRYGAKPLQLEDEPPPEEIDRRLEARRFVREAEREARAEKGLTVTSIMLTRGEAHVHKEVEHPIDGDSSMQLFRGFMEALDLLEEREARWRARREGRESVAPTSQPPRR